MSLHHLVQDFWSKCVQSASYSLGILDKIMKTLKTENSFKKNQCQYFQFQDILRLKRHTTLKIYSINSSKVSSSSHGLDLLSVKLTKMRILHILEYKIIKPQRKKLPWFLSHKLITKSIHHSNIKMQSNLFLYPGLSNESWDTDFEYISEAQFFQLFSCFLMVWLFLFD